MSHCGNCGVEILEMKTHCHECGMVICDECSKRHPVKFSEPCYFAVKKNVNDAGAIKALFS